MVRYRWNKKETVEQYLFISTTVLNKYGYFGSISGQFGTLRWLNRQDEVIGYISIQVKLFGQTGMIQFFNKYCPIKLVSTSCYFGGKRWWFICPLVKDGVVCGRRVCKLYLGENSFGCRHCYSLTYRSCQKHDSRVDWLCKHPDFIALYLDHPNLSKALLGVQAALKIKGLM